jgi:DHA1 family multidrug resistance protein B-like MFS transporter
LLSFILVLTVIPESFDPKKSSAQHESIFKAYRIVSKDRAFMIYCFASIFIAMIFTQIDFYLPVHLSDSFQTVSLFGFKVYGQRMLSIMLVVNTAIIVIGMGLMNKLTKHWSRSKGIALGISIQGFGFILAFLGNSFAWEFVAAVIFTLGEMINVPFSQALRADLMEGDRVGTYSGVFSVTQPIASVLCGLMVSGSVFYGNVGTAFLMIIVILLGVVPALLAIRLHDKSAKVR